MGREFGNRWRVRRPGNRWRVRRPGNRWRVRRLCIHWQTQRSDSGAKRRYRSAACLQKIWSRLARLVGGLSACEDSEAALGVGARRLGGWGLSSVTSIQNPLHWGPTRGSHHRASHSRLPPQGVSLEIPVFRIFLVKNSGKIVKIGFLDSRDQNKILKFWWFFICPVISI